MANNLGGGEGMGRWKEGLNFQCRGRGAPWVVEWGASCVCGPRVANGARATRGWPVCIHISAFWGQEGMVERWWAESQLASSRSDDETGEWLALQRKEAYVLGGQGGKHKCVTQVLFSSHQTTERRDPRRVS